MSKTARHSYRIHHTHSKYTDHRDQILSRSYGKTSRKPQNAGISLRLVLICSLAAAAILMILLLSGSSIHAEEDLHACKRYTSIQVQSGDTLWSIACEHMDGHYSSISDYIEEVKFINELDSDLIHACGYLVVPYYTSEA